MPSRSDNDYAIWTAFANHYWPALYFVDRDGIVRDEHFGEGRYEQSERRIQRLLDVERELVSVEGVGDEAEADWDHLGTPETYLGYARGGSGGGRVEGLGLNEWALRARGRRARGRGARGGRREHRVPLPRTRRASRAVAPESRSRSPSA